MSPVLREDLPLPGDASLVDEYRALLQFIHLAPVGLVKARRDGRIDLMNPMAAQLLAPLGFGEGTGGLNLLTILDRASPDIRTLVQLQQGSAGVVCENYRITLPEADHAPEEAPVALGVTLMMLGDVLDSLMAVITDESAAVRLQHLKASWRT
jgi:hypothetical protein